MSLITLQLLQGHKVRQGVVVVVVRWGGGERNYLKLQGGTKNKQARDEGQT